MKGRVVGWLFLALFGVGSASVYAQSFTGYLQVGSVIGQLAGHSFYVATGEVHLYRVGYLGDQADTGQQVESAVAVRVDSATGTVLKIVTLQPNGFGDKSATGSSAENSATAASGQEYIVSDLLGGIQVSDIEPYGTWLDAIQAMKQAIVQLNSVGQFPSANVPPVVVGQPQVVVQPPPVIVSPPIVEPPPFYTPPPYYAPPPVYSPPPVVVQQPPTYVPPPVFRQPPVRVPPPFQGPGPTTIWRPIPSVPVMPGSNVGGR